MSRRFLRSLGLGAVVAGLITAIPALTPAAGASGVGPASLPTLEAVGSVKNPQYEGGSFGISGLMMSADGEHLYGKTYGGIMGIDLPSMTATGYLDLDVFTGPTAYSPDHLISWIVGEGTDASSNPQTYLQSLTMNTGAIGTPIDLGRTTNGVVSPAALTTTATRAYILFSNAPARLMSVNLTTNTVIAVEDVSDNGFSGDLYRDRVVLSADGSRLYVSRGDNILSYDPNDLSAAPTLLGVAGMTISVYDDEPLNASNKGHLYALDNGTLTIYDLDNSLAVLHTTAFISGPVYASAAMEIASNGDVVAAQYSEVAWYDIATGTVIPIDIKPQLVRPGNDPYILEVHIDENPTYGTCVYTANNTDGSYTAISKDGADCGPFGKRLGDLSDVDVDGSSTLTIDAPTAGARAKEWVAVAVFAGCTLVDVIEPPIPTSYTIDWADVKSATTVTVRAYTKDHLDAAGITDPADIDCDTTPLEQVTAGVKYLPFGSDHVGAGDATSCSSVDADSYCWGANGDGQFGDGTTDDNLTPIKSVDPVTGATFDVTDIDEIDGGSYHTCALADGSVYCWGGNGDGQLGDGTFDAHEVPQLVSANDGFTNTAVTSLSVGDEFNCAVEAGVVYCWGRNGDGQVGDGTTDSRELPTKVADVASVFTNTGVTNVGAGWGHACAIASGAVYCWGTNYSGQLGDGTTTPSPNAVKVVDNGGEGYTNDSNTQVVASDESTCVIRSGSVYCWGYDDSGKLGWDYAGDSYEPIKVLDNGSDGFTNDLVTWLTAGEDHICAIRASVVYCWGYNGDGQIGSGSWDDAYKPTRVTDVTGGFTNANITDADAGAAHTCVIADGKAYCWGDNGDGQLGTGDDNGSNAPRPVHPPAGDDVDPPPPGESTVTIDSPNPSRGSVLINGSPCTLPCSRNVANGTVTLTAVPAPGYRFAGWSGGGCSGTAPCTVTLSAALSVTALFEPIDGLPATGSDGALALLAVLFLACGAGLLIASRRRLEA